MFTGNKQNFSSQSKIQFYTDAVHRKKQFGDRWASLQITGIYLEPSREDQIEALETRAA